MSVVRVLLSSSLFSIALLLGCGGDGGEVTPGAPVKAPAVEKKVVEATTASGESVEVEMAAGELPKDFPKDFPIYPEAVVVAGMAMPGQGTIVSMRVAATAGDVFSFYSEQMPKGGWHIRDENDAQRNITAAKDGRVASLNVRDVGSGRTEIGISLE